MSQSLVSRRPETPQLVQAMIAPGAHLPRGVEEALFGSSMHELGGMEPGVIRLEEIQYRLIEHILDTLIQRIRAGQRDALREQIHFAQDVIGGQLLGILAQVLQAKETAISKASAPTLQQKLAYAVGLLEEPSARKEKEKVELERVIETTRNGVSALTEAVKISLLSDSLNTMPQSIKAAMDARSFLVTRMEELNRLITRSRGIKEENFNRQVGAFLDSLHTVNLPSLESSAVFSALKTSSRQLKEENINEENSFVKKRAYAESLPSLTSPLDICRHQVQAEIDAFLAIKMREFLSQS